MTVSPNGRLPVHQRAWRLPAPELYQCKRFRHDRRIVRREATAAIFVGRYKWCSAVVAYGHPLTATEFEVDLRKVGADRQKWLVGAPGCCVAHAVAEVESGRRALRTAFTTVRCGTRLT